MADPRQDAAQVDPSERTINESTPGIVDEADDVKQDDIQDESEISE